MQVKDEISLGPGYFPRAVDLHFRSNSLHIMPHISSLLVAWRAQVAPIYVYEHQSAETMGPFFLPLAGMVRSKSGLSEHLLSKRLIDQVNG